MPERVRAGSIHPEMGHFVDVRDCSCPKRAFRAKIGAGRSIVRTWDVSWAQGVVWWARGSFREQMGREVDVLLANKSGKGKEGLTGSFWWEAPAMQPQQP